MNRTSKTASAAACVPGARAQPRQVLFRSNAIYLVDPEATRSQLEDDLGHTLGAMNDLMSVWLAQGPERVMEALHLLTVQAHGTFEAMTSRPRDEQDEPFERMPAAHAESRESLAQRTKPSAGSKAAGPAFNLGVDFQIAPGSEAAEIGFGAVCAQDAVLAAIEAIVARAENTDDASLSRLAYAAQYLHDISAGMWRTFYDLAAGSEAILGQGGARS